MRSLKPFRHPLLALLVAAVACEGAIGENGPPTDPITPDGPVIPDGPSLHAAGPEPASRLLTQVELERSLQQVLADWTDDGTLRLDGLPATASHEWSFSRVARAQSMSVSTLETLMPAFEDIAARLTTPEVLERHFPDVCPADRIPTDGFFTQQTHLDPVDLWDEPRVFEFLVAVPETGTYDLSISWENGRETRFDIELEGEVAGSITCPSRTLCERSLPLTFDSVDPTVIRLLAYGSHYLDIELARVSLGAPPPTNVLEGEEARACARAFIDRLTPALWRRPVSDDERAALIALFDGLIAPSATEDGTDGAGFSTALRAVAQAVMASPYFLHVIQRGAVAEVEGGYVPLAGWEIASRMSYALCESPPDAALREAIPQLHDASVRAAHAARLLDTCGHDTVTRFFSEWLWLPRLAQWTADPLHFPAYTEAFRNAAQDQAENFFRARVYGDSAGGIGDLLTAPLPSFPGDALPGEAAPMGAELRGALALPAIAMVTSKPHGTAPVIRGVYVLEQLLCHELPDPPADVDVNILPPDETATTRERWTAHSADPSCASCHSLIDPVGFALEDTDALGRFRTTEHGRPVDARGGAPALNIEDGTLEGSRALADAIADSDALRQCFARQWLRFAVGRLEHEGDAEALTVVAEAAETSIRDAMVTLVAQPTFIQRRTSP